MSLTGERYIFPIRSKAKGRGRMNSAPYFSCFCDNEEGDNGDAIGIKNWANANLANYAKVGINKVIQENISCEIPASHTITDVKDSQLKYRYYGTAAAAGTDEKDQSFGKTLNIPGLKLDYDKEVLKTLITTNFLVKDLNGLWQRPNQIMEPGDIYRNIIEGGPVDETIGVPDGSFPESEVH